LKGKSNASKTKTKKRKTSPNLGFKKGFLYPLVFSIILLFISLVVYYGWKSGFRDKQGISLNKVISTTQEDIDILTTSELTKIKLKYDVKNKELINKYEKQITDKKNKIAKIKNSQN